MRALIGSLSLVIAPAVLGLLSSDIFRLQEIVVRASSASLAEEVGRAIRVPAGANTIMYPRRALAEQALTVPRVLSVHTIRGYPSRITLVVEERRPTFGLQTDQGFVLVDDEGVLLLHTGRAERGMPVVLGDRAGDFVIGGRLSADCLRIVLECIEGALAAGIGLDFTLDLRLRYDYRLHLPSGVTVKLGGPDNIAHKVRMAAAIERHIMTQGGAIEYIDVRIPARPVYKPAGGGQA